MGRGLELGGAQCVSVTHSDGAEAAMVAPSAHPGLAMPPATPGLDRLLLCGRNPVQGDRQHTLPQTCRPGSRSSVGPLGAWRDYRNQQVDLGEEAGW